MPQNTFNRRLCRLYTIPRSRIISRFSVTLLNVVFGLLGKLVVSNITHSNRVYSRITSAESPSFCIIFNASLTHLTAPPTSVTWLQLLRKLTNTGTSTALTAGTRWSKRTRLRALSRLLTSEYAREYYLRPRLETLWNYSRCTSWVGIQHNGKYCIVQY